MDCFQLLKVLYRGMPLIRGRQGYYVTDYSLCCMTTDGDASEQEGPSGQAEQLPGQHHSQGGRGTEEEGEERSREGAGR